MLALLLVTLIGSHDPTTDRRMIGFFSDVVTRAGVTNGYSESAAFLVLDTRGDVQCLAWPRTNEYQQDTFIGQIPLGTVAIVHTHPDGLDRLPTTFDEDKARELHLPIIVLTRTDIAMFDPASEKTTLLVKGKNWIPRRLALHCEADWLAR